MFKSEPKAYRKPLLPMNLQYFADGDVDGDGEGKKGTEKLELTEDELAKKIEAESDRKLESALKSKKKEWDESLQSKIEDAIKEKERLSSLSEKERKDEELSTREKELEKRIKDIERKEMKADAVSDLKEKDLPSSFADFLLADNAENTLKNINEFKKAFDEAVNSTVKERLRQDTPGVSGGKKEDVHTYASQRNNQDKQINNAPDLWGNNSN